MDLKDVAAEACRIIAAAARGDMDAAARVVMVSPYLSAAGPMTADEHEILRVMRGCLGFDIRPQQAAQIANLTRTRTQTALSRLVARGFLGTRGGLYWWVIPDGSVMVDRNGTVHGYSADRDLPRFGARW